MSADLQGVTVTENPSKTIIKKMRVGFTKKNKFPQRQCCDQFWEQTVLVSYVFFSAFKGNKQQFERKRRLRGTRTRGRGPQDPFQRGSKCER